MEMQHSFATAYVPWLNKHIRAIRQKRASSCACHRLQNLGSCDQILFYYSIYSVRYQKPTFVAPEAFIVNDESHWGKPKITLSDTSTIPRKRDVGYVKEGRDSKTQYKETATITVQNEEISKPNNQCKTRLRCRASQSQGAGEEVQTHKRRVWSHYTSAWIVKIGFCHLSWPAPLHLDLLYIHRRGEAWGVGFKNVVQIGVSSRAIKTL